MFLSFCLKAQTGNLPNVLLVIADDVGVDMINGYGFGGLKPTTPTLDSLRGVGVTFENCWSAPVCTPTRASIMSGKHGIKTNVTKAPGNLDLVHTSLFNSLPVSYSSAVVGKWHVSFPLDTAHPTQHGVDYYSGIMEGAVSNYRNWDRLEAGVSVTDTNYVSTVFTDKSLAWINGKTEPWLLWLAHVAPHTPIHTPPANMYSINAVGSNYRKYVAMIESFDYELNRIIQSIPDSVLENTVIIVLGDNGTPGNMLQDYPAGHGKNTLYEGGVRVPMVIAGKTVNRKGEREKAMVHVTDLYSTILDLAGVEQDGGQHNSLSFVHLLNSSTISDAPTRDYNYVELESTINGFAIREKRYKLIQFQDGTQEFYDLSIDSLEFNNIIATLSAEQTEIKTDLEKEATAIRSDWSCRDHIKNGDEKEIDCGGSICEPCETSIEEISDASWSFYPNPVAETLIIEYSARTEEVMHIEVFALNGGLLLQEEWAQENSKIELNLSQLGAQELLIVIKNSSGQVVQSKTVVKGE